MSKKKLHISQRGGNAFYEAQAERSRRAAEQALEDNCDENAIATLKYWRAARRDPEWSPEFIYFVQEEEHGTIKIGRAVDPVRRLRGLQCGNPDHLVIRELILGGEASERRLHSHWVDAHVRAEWFGKGYEQAILAFAAETARRQIEDDRKGLPVQHVTHLIPEAA